MTIPALAPAVEPSRWRAVTVASVTAVEAALVWRVGWTAPLAAYCWLGLTLTVAAVVDARTRRIPNLLLWPSYPVALGLLAAAAGVDGTWWLLGRAVIAMVVLAAFYLVLALVTGGRQMGLADVTLGGLVGLLLGWVGWSALFSGVILGWVIALAVVVALRLGRPSRPVVAIPAGPCLWFGALVAILAIR